MQDNILIKLIFHCAHNLLHNNEINFSCAHIFWMYHNFLNVMYILPWRFSKSGIFGIWYDCKAFHEFTIKTILIFDILLNCLEHHFFGAFFCGSKFFNTMSCRNHKMWRNNGSRAEIVIVMWSILFFDVMKWYNKAPFFFCGRKSVIIYRSKVRQGQLQRWTEHSTLIFENLKPVEISKKFSNIIWTCLKVV